MPADHITPEEWRRVKTITAEALERPASERLAFVAAECGSDGRLRDEVWSLLVASDKAAMLYEAPMFQLGNVQALVADLERTASPLIGQRIGPYRIVRELGRGGMGAAYLAERDDETFERLVAIKLIKRGMDTDGILRRFRHERRILANLNHPNIATLLDGGTTDDDRPYFVMEYIDGLPIDVFCDRHQRSVRDRLELFRQVCAAVHYAHRNRVVHRDLKPANILVTADGIPKLLDFGIAKLLGSDEDLLTAETTVTGRAMTPQYASPEQLRGEPITPSSDVYSLGILLYRLVAGSLPYRLDGCTPAQAERVVCEEDPARPSAVLGGTARTPEERRWRRDVQGNVDAIVLTALRKKPEHRYSTVQALADDVERHLGGLPITARQPGVRDRARTLARRMKTDRRVGAVAAVLVVLSIIAAVSIFVQRRSTLTSGSTIESLAVLPMSNVQKDGELDFLAEGMTDGLINRLSNVPRLKVIARDSVYRYSGSAADYGEIARQLGVGVVLTGGIASSGSNVQVTVELINAREHRRLWARRYDRPLRDIQVLQAEVTQEVVDHLQLQFSGPEPTRPRRVFTTDSEAYQLYLKGRYVWNKRRVDDFRKSIGYFQQALARDSSFALAYSGLADSYGLLTEYHAEPATRTYEPAKRAAATALAIDEGLAEASTSLAYINQFYEWDWLAAERGYKRAIEINPNYATAHQWYAEFLSARGRHDEALAEIRRAEQLDPLSLIINAVEANMLYMARRYDDAIEKCRQIIAMDAEFPEVYEYLKRSYDQQDLFAQAIAARQTRRRLVGLPSGDTPALQAARSTTDRHVYWRNRLTQELEEAKEEGLQPFDMAEILAQVGDRERALDWLEKACSNHDFMMMYVRLAPNLDPIREEPRFQRLLQRSCRV